MEVIIKPHHFQNNTYENGAQDGKRKCPLYEALIEQGIDVNRVGVVDIDIFEDGRWKLYSVPKDWNRKTVDEYIYAAEGYDQKEITVEINELSS